MIVRDPTTHEYKGIKCDRCTTMAPDARTIMEGSGLNNMGWSCSGGTHLCPKHSHRDVR